MLRRGSWMCCVIAAGGLAAAAATGCYRPAEVPCGITCAGGTCPGQLVCNASDQLCYAPETGVCGAVGTGDDGPPKTDCLGVDPFRVCVAPAARPQQWTAPVMFDTDVCLAELGGQLITVGDVVACAVVATDITIAERVDVHGSRPLIIAADTAITITGKLDVASHAGKRGPAANTACTPPDGGRPDTRGAGGAGGSFRGRGGDGAVPAEDAMHMPNQALDPIAAPIRLIGGCAGGAGGDTTGVGKGSAGGASGGAVYLVAGQRIELRASGWINASGAGGEEVMANIAGGNGGGGGGGSGGLVRIDAPSMVIEGVVVANGGGGAAGASAASNGLPGEEADTANPEAAAFGGPSVGRGGDGNDTSAGYAGDPGQMPVQGSGGGGGGGGGGYVVIIGTRTGSGVICPPP